MQQVRTINAAGAPTWLVAKASELGFDLCGVLPAGELAAPDHFRDWLDSGFAGEMRYLHDPRRADPASLMPGARSVIVCAVNYNPPAPYSTEAAATASQDDRPKGWISRYAWGGDYHLIVGERLDRLVDALRQHFGAPSEKSFAARAYVDTGPVSERMAAKLAGLGWLGKNTCLINRELGSWLFVGVILTSLDLAASASDESPARSLAPDLCGNCRLCLDACPTGALVEPYVLDARRCISYLTIELRGTIPEEFRAGVGWQVFGCDICQDVCPWNRNIPSASVPAFASPQKKKEQLQAPELLWLLSLTEEDFRETFRKSAVRRAKWRGLIRNACVAAGNALRQPRMKAPERKQLKTKLAQWAASGDAVIAEHARWALAQEQTGPLQSEVASELAPTPRATARPLRAAPVVPGER